MRSGRPSYHIKAQWISCFDPETNVVEFYQLDEKGHIIKTNNKIVPQKTTKFEQSLAEDPPFKEPIVKASAEPVVKLQEEAASSAEFGPFMDCDLEFSLFEDCDIMTGDLLEF